MPQLDLLSFPSQLFWLCVVLLIGLVVTLKYILPSIIATLHGRKFVSEAKYLPSHTDKGFKIVNNYITRLNASLDNVLQFEYKEQITSDFISAIKIKHANAQKFFLSPFFFFYVTDSVVLLLAFFIAFTGLFFYIRNLPIFQKSSYYSILNSYKAIRQALPPKRDVIASKLFS